LRERTVNVRLHRIREALRKGIIERRIEQVLLVPDAVQRAEELFVDLLMRLESGQPVKVTYSWAADRLFGDQYHWSVIGAGAAQMRVAAQAATMGANVRVVAPETLLPTSIERMGVERFHDMAQGLEGCDIVMMLRLQRERMNGSFIPSTREYFHFFGLDAAKLANAKPDALILHPGPMNRGVEIDSEVADDIGRSAIHEQVEMGVAVRMACLDMLVGTTENDRKAAS